MYYNARYYDPSLGRFLQADTYLDGMNRYAYCGNNPIIYNDPTGHIGDWFAYAFAAGVSYFNTVIGNDASWAPWEWDDQDVGYFLTFGGVTDFSLGFGNNGTTVDAGNGHYNSGEQQQQELISENLSHGGNSIDIAIGQYAQQAVFEDYFSSELSLNDQLSLLNDFTGNTKNSGHVVIDGESYNLHYNFTRGGCNLRAYLMGESLEDIGFDVIYAELSYPKQGFNYHTAPSVKIGNKRYIIDPMYSNKAMTTLEWAKKQGKPSSSYIKYKKYPRQLADKSNRGGYFTTKYIDGGKTSTKYNSRIDFCVKSLYAISIYNW